MEQIIKKEFESYPDRDALPIKLVERTVGVVDIHEPDKKIERFARICYRSEDKISENSSEKLIKFCIAHDHGSILEHYYISVFFPREGHYKDVLGDDRMTPGYIWDACDSIAKRKFTTLYWDRYLKVNKDIPDGQPLVWRCTSGTIRVWRDIVRSGIEASIKQDIRPAVVFHLALLKELYKFAPIFFQDIVDWVDGIVSFSATQSKSISYLTEGMDPSEIKFKSIPDEKLNIGIVVGESIGAYVSFICTTERATSHQLVRHRVECSYSQESQRYVNYANKGINVVAPLAEQKFADDATATRVAQRWIDAMIDAGQAYLDLIEDGVKPESARSVLPNACATTIGVTMTFGSLEHFFNKRLASDAQFEIRDMAANMLKILIDGGHPILYNINPYSIIRWAKWMVEQKQKFGIEYWTGVIEKWKDVIVQTKKAHEAEAKRQAELAEKAQELAKSKKEEDAKPAEEVKEEK